MILGDISEHKKTHDRFFKRLNSNYGIKELGCWDCGQRNILLEKLGKLYCTSESDVSILCENGFRKPTINTKCLNCEHRKYVRFSDFEIAVERGFYERKTAADFLASRRNRLYKQLTLMDTFIEGRKGLILEGMPRDVHTFKDSKNQFSGITKITHDLRGLSPLEQAVVMGGGEKSRNWTLSFIRECKMRDIEFVQTWDLDETIDFLEQCDEGFDETPKLRVIPKRYPEISLDQNILVLVPTIGKVGSENLLRKHGSLGKLITDVRKMKKGDELNKTYRELKKVFGY